jgi:hypothetical protein
MLPPINIENLLAGGLVESERLEFKEGWKFGFRGNREGYWKVVR